jgi:hypothetical protein
LGPLAVLGLAALAAGANVELRSEPGHLLSGGAGQARILIEVQGLAQGAKVSLTASAGTVGEVTSLGGGRFQAIFKPPPERYPRIALLRALVEGGPERLSGWLAVPLYGSETLELETEPNAKVEVVVATRTFGPIAANARGKVAVPVVVPPGVGFATIRSTDRLGNQKERQFNLRPPPFLRVGIVPLGRDGSASWADPDPLPLELYAVRPDGQPLAAAEIDVIAAPGSVGGIAAIPGRPGHFRAQYRAPERVSQPTAGLRASLREDPTAAAARVALRPGPPAKVLLRLEPPEWTAGDSQPVHVSAIGRDAKGNDFPVQATYAAEMGEVSPVAEGRALWKLPNALGGRDRAQITAAVGTLRGEAPLRLRSAAPARARMEWESEKVPAGEEADGDLLVEDVFGNAVSDAELTAVAEKGTATVKPRRPGHYQVDWAIGGEVPPGPVKLEIKHGQTVIARAPLVVLPARARWGISAGVMLDGQSNFARASSFAPRLEVSLWAWRTLEMFLSGGMSIYRDQRTPYSEAGPGVSKDVALSGIQAGAGARFGLPLTAWVSIYGSALAGGQRTDAEVRVVGGPSDGARQETIIWSPLLQLAGGASLRVGPGRMMGQVQATTVPGKEQVQGNLGGLSLSVGYLLQIR